MIQQWILMFWSSWDVEKTPAEGAGMFRHVSLNNPTPAGRDVTRIFVTIFVALELQIDLKSKGQVIK